MIKIVKRNAVVSTTVERCSYKKSTFELVETLFSGEKRVIDRAYASDWRKAPDWVKKHPDFIDAVRQHRLDMIWVKRYGKMESVLKPISFLEIEKSLEIKDRHTAVIKVSCLQEMEETKWWWAERHIEGFVKTSQKKLWKYCKEYEIPTLEVFHVEVLKEEPHVEIKKDRQDYVSNDGRSSRYETEVTYLEYLKTSVQFTPKEGWEWVGVIKCSFYNLVFQCDVSKWNWHIVS